MFFRVQECIFFSREMNRMRKVSLKEIPGSFDVSVWDCDIEQAVTIYLTDKYDTHDTICSAHA